jgi:cytochrome c5
MRPRTVVVVLLPLIVVGALLWRVTRDHTRHYDSIEEHFKYGSIGSEPGGSLLRPIGGLLPPYWIFKALPKICGIPSYDKFGLIHEAGHDLPVGISRRTRLGTDVLGVNCALCHAGTVREAPGAEAKVIVGMPPQQVDVQGFFRFIFDCIESTKFNAPNVIREIRALNGPANLFERVKYRLLIPRLRGQVREVDGKIGLLTTDRVVASGPGRLDTVNPGKALEVGWNLEEMLESSRREELIATADFPPTWNLAKRRGMRLHWDGNVGSVREALHSAALAVGAKPQTLDADNGFRRIVDDLLQRPSPRYPFPVDAALAARGRPLFEQSCARCHDFGGPEVGKVTTPNSELGADSHRLRAFSEQYATSLPAALNRKYAKSRFRFTTLQKNDGYVNVPLDGIWARAPYLHNGSVPTLRDLLELEKCRPPRFHRGSDVYDPEYVGFVAYADSSPDPSCQPRREPRAPEGLFLFDTRIAGNRNTGHLWGTALSPDEKRALLEHLKTL